MNNKQTVFLNLLAIRFPITAIVSIAHRISGVLIFLALPAFLWLLQHSLVSASDFIDVKAWMAQTWLKFISWLVLTAVFYHLFAGIRHIVMDMGYGESLKGGRLGAKIVLALSVVTAFILGAYLWF